MVHPKKTVQTNQHDIFKSRLDQIINMKHPYVILADEIDWDWLDNELKDLYNGRGRPALPTRFMLGLFILKEVENLSDERVCEQ